MKKQLLLILMMLLPMVAMASSSDNAETVSIVFSLIAIIVSIFVIIFFFGLCIDVNGIRKFLESKLDNTIRESVKRALNEIKEEENRESNTN